MRSLPLILKLPRRTLARRDAVRVLVGRRWQRGDRPRAELVSVFAFKDDELEFARALAERTNLWLFRVNQRAFAGDFVVVDVSSPDVTKRPAIALDLKRGGRIREDRAGIQMQRTDRAIAELAARGIVASTCTPLHLIGDARSVLATIDRVLQRARPGRLHAPRVPREAG